VEGKEAGDQGAGQGLMSAEASWAGIARARSRQQQQGQAGQQRPHTAVEQGQGRQIGRRHRIGEAPEAGSQRSKHLSQEPLP